MVRRKRLPNPHSPEEVRKAFAIQDADVKETYVPYTGADKDVDLGSYSLTCTNVNLDGYINNADYIQFDITYSDGSAEGRLQWNSEDGTLEVGMPGGNVNLQIGHEQLRRCRNVSGSLILNGTPVVVSGISGKRPTIVPAAANSYSTAFVYGVVTENIDNNSNGYVCLQGVVRDVDTSSWSEGDRLYLGTTGGLTRPAPSWPNLKIYVARVIYSHATEGEIEVLVDINPWLSACHDVDDTGIADGSILVYDTATTSWKMGSSALPSANNKSAFHNGTFRETFDALLSSDGVTITLSLEQSGGGDLTMQFSDGQTVLDCTPAQTITITPGTDTIPVGTMVYIPQSTKVLTAGTSWPIGAEHIKVCYILVPSAQFVFDHGGGYVNQNWNDHLSGTDNQGHLAHVCSKLRQQGADWYSGVGPNGATVSYFTIGAGTVTWQSTEGLVSQLHPHTFLAKDTSGGTDLIAIPNDSVTPYYHTGELYDIDSDSTGTLITNNRYFSLVFWGVANKTGELDLVMCNLPSGFYVLLADALIDSNDYDTYAFPREFDTESGTAFLICRSTFQMGATWTHIQTEDLRGKTPGKSAGPNTNDHGSLGGLTDVADHPGYSTTDGTRPFTGTVGGVTPVADSDLATKAYVDGSGGITDVTNGEASAITICEPIYLASGEAKLAQANNADTSFVFGLVKDATIASAASGKILFSGVLEATTGQWDAVTGETGGLTPDNIYYLSSVSAGKLLSAAPDIETSGSWITQVGQALSTTKLKVEPKRIIGL
jgi:hypothetical protein